MKALFFDLDNTLYKYQPCNTRALDAAHAVLGEAAPIDRDAFQTLHDAVRAELAEELAGLAASRNRVHFFQRIVTRSGAGPDPALVLELTRTYWDTFLEAMRPIEGAAETLARLAEQYQLALVTNHVTEVQLRKLCRLGLDPFFPVIVTSEEAGVGKPDARIFELALRRIGARPEETTMIGDEARSDVDGALGAGIRAIQIIDFVPEDRQHRTAPRCRFAALADRLLANASPAQHGDVPRK